MSPARDVVIAGGGMVGISLALELADRLPAQQRITLVESFPMPGATSAGDYHPSFDARSTALSYSSRVIYERLGVWETLSAHVCPIETIHVSNQGRFGSTLMRATDYGWPALGYVIENPWLGRCLAAALQRQGRVEVISPARVAGAKSAADGSVVQLSGEHQQELQTRLLVVADGAGSGLRATLGMPVSEKSYDQHAVIANVATARSHDGCAFERFTRHGPLALLPLQGVSGAAHRSALVWTLAAPDYEHYCNCPEDEFLAELQSRFGYRLGRLTRVGERHHYPLSLVRAVEQVRQGVVVMGNAAHALHPVAGQGFNLALRDVAALAAVLQQAVAAGVSPGDLATLQRYERQQSADQARTIGFSDQLPALFARRDPLLGVARDLALSGLDLAPALKRGFVRQAAGVAALGE
ncbi:2-octaprenyl-6-methoxyphenyl hydroxylase [Mangrovimicrobium sediminis]|uniref:2-octaprenyl-6-methoxyphenyl hydroxylase n=1 Tax=Mangrovimicrobium sediminis TaxID=2562682 RepID=A0A4Z0M130_9GAMM|nr:2-octaprenyl-6-methoxyphenyl hydroxylase [Haliea sp. SAOS-164]TGD73078.1 2-octaprenyl-6-methoxyphenyl hydroxylase [Haliea sp. SAOS-164]